MSGMQYSYGNTDNENTNKYRTTEHNNTTKKISTKNTNEKICIECGQPVSLGFCYMGQFITCCHPSCFLKTQ